MLKPFQIRDLYDPSLQPDSNLDGKNAEQQSDLSLSDEWDKFQGDGKGVNDKQASATHSSSDTQNIQILAREYDEIISSHPQSSLMYMDDDDGETVTVGSSFELTQRLDEPSNSSSSLSSLSGSHSPYQIVSDPVHIFDIRRSQSTLNLWREYQKRTTTRRRVTELENSSSSSSIVESLSTDSHHSQETDLGPKTNGSNGLASKSSQQDLRESWLQACVPPSVLSARSGSGEPSSLQSEQSWEGLDAKDEPATAKSGLCSVQSCNSITEEGKRQAQEAGARFRSWKHVPAESTAASNLTSTIEGNPWASFTKSSARLDDKPPSNIPQAAPESPKSSSPVHDEYPPLLAAFEAQMSMIMEEHAAALKDSLAETSTDIPKTGIDETPAPATVPNAVTSQPSPSPADVLAQTVRTMLDGATHLSTELHQRLPEIEQQLSNAPGTLPDHVGNTVHGALRTIGGQIQVVANAAQDASTATRQAAQRTRAPDHHVIEQVVAERLRGVAGDLTHIGRSLFSALETGLGASRSTPAKPAEQTATQNKATPPEQQPGSAESKTGSNSASSAVQGSSISLNSEMAPNTHTPTQTPHVNSCVVDTIADQDHKTQIEEQAEKGPSPQLSTSKLTTPQSGIQELLQKGVNSKRFLPDSTLGSSAEGPSQPTFDYPRESRRTNPTRKEPDHSYRHERSRSPFSLRQHHHPSAQKPRPMSTFTPLHNINHYSHGFRLHGPQSSSADPFPIRIRRATTVQDTLFIGNIDLGATEGVIRDLLAEQGFLAKIHLPIDSHSRIHPGFCYLKFPSIYAAKAAMEALQGTHVGGKPINVEFSHGVNFDELQAGLGRPDLSSRAAHTNPGIPTAAKIPATRPAIPHGLRHRPSLNLPSPEPYKAPKSKPSVTFADPENAAITTNIKRHRSLGALRPFASGGAFPYRSPNPYLSSRPSNNSVDLENPNKRQDGKRDNLEGTEEPQNKLNAGALLDQEDADPEFSARYPSLLATQDLRRANTVGSAPKKSVPSQPAFSPESEMARFPPVSQIEAQSLVGRQRTAEPKARAISPQNAQSSTPIDKTFGSEVPNPQSRFPHPRSSASNRLPGAWPHEASEISVPDLIEQLDRAEQTSGATREPTGSLHRSNTTVAADPAARLTGPFDPDNVRRWNHSDGHLRRSATERRHKRPSNHPIQFNGMYRPIGGRIAARDLMRQEPSWEIYQNHPRNFPATPAPPRANNASETVPAQPEMSQRTTRDSTAPASDAPGAGSDPNSKIDACIEHLQALGFQHDDDQGEQRLRVYACAVDGNLGDAIEMIEEERKAYEQQPSLV